MLKLNNLLLFIMMGFALSVNAQEPQVEMVAKQHNVADEGENDNVDNFFDVAGRPFVACYKSVERTFVNGYKAVESGIVSKFTDRVSPSINYKRGYRANIELSALIPDTWAITSSHGFSFGDGFYFGAGVGFAAEFMPNYKSKPTYLTPLFVDVKHSFVNRLASPFINLSTGAYADITNTGIRYFLAPSIGIDIGRFAIKMGYEYQIGVWKYSCGVGKHSAKVGVAFTF